MMKTNEKKNKHLTLQDRLEIQGCLDKGMTFKAIAYRVQKDQTTISKEVKKHIARRPYGNGDNTTVSEEKLCPQLRKAPFVCNPCDRRYHCRQTRYFYVANIAHKEYLSLLAECRTGIPLCKEQFYHNDRIISEGIKKGQHLYHILQTNDLNVSKSTVYRHLHKGYLSIAPIDMSRVVKFKPRRQHALETIPPKAKIGRAYDDFLSHCEANSLSHWVEMDTVIGTPGGKAILTFDFTFCNFMIGFLLERKTAAEVSSVVEQLKNELLSNDLSFAALFSTILTDNGGEFSNVTALENSPDGTKEASLFFCDPYQSSQKPHVEKNHSLFRDIVPSGRSFDELTQSMVSLIFSHVNSVKRKSLNGKSPYEVFTFTFDRKTADVLGIQEIAAQEVVQSPALLKSLLISNK